MLETIIERVLTLHFVLGFMGCHYLIKSKSVNSDSLKIAYMFAFLLIVVITLRVNGLI